MGWAGVAEQGEAKEMPNPSTTTDTVATTEGSPAAHTPRKPRINKWELVKFYCFFVFIIGGAIVLFDPTAVRLDSGKFQLVAGALTLLLVLLLLLPSKPLPGSKYARVSRIAANKNRIALAHQEKLNASKKRR